jgi:hypothetical protein
MCVGQPVHTPLQVIARCLRVARWIVRPLNPA